MNHPEEPKQDALWKGTPEQIEGPVDPALFIDKASLLMPVGMRATRDGPGSEWRVEIASLEDDPEIARDLNTLMRHAGGSGQSLWGRTKTETLGQGKHYFVPAGANLAAGSLLDGVARMAGLAQAILAVARQSLRDPEDKSYDADNLIHTTLDSPETPFFVNVQDVMKGTDSIFDPYSANSGFYRASGES